MKTNTLEAAITAGAKELKNQRAAKAKRIVLGVDAHLRGYQAARKIDDSAVGPVSRFRSQTELLLYIEKQRQQAEQVVVVYEAGPLGYVLYRQLTACGVGCYVCAPEASQQKRTRRKNNQIDARSLTSNLFNYLQGNDRALQLVRVPSEWSTGDSQRLGSITKVGVPAIRRIITEMVWRIILFQPQYQPVQKWQQVLRGTHRGLKKKAVVAIGRQLMVDLWRLQTGRLTAKDLNLVMIDG